MAVDPKYHPELYRMFEKACDTQNMSDIDYVARKVAAMPKWEVAMFCTQVSLCPEPPMGAWYMGILTGALRRAEEGK